jgi:hypothetical protein
MADFGLQLFNSSGNVQIDSTYKNLGLREKGSVVSSSSAPIGSTGFYYATFTTVAGTCPVVAFRSNGTCYLSHSTTSGNSTTYYFSCSAANVTVQYWIFDDLANVTLSGNYGLQVFNAAGGKVFDSRSKYMRIVDLVRGTNEASNGAMASGFTQSYSGLPAVVQGQLYYYLTYGIIGASSAPYTVQRILTAATVTFPSGGVTWQSKTADVSVFTNQSSLPDSRTHRSYDYLVLDVSNI